MGQIIFFFILVSSSQVGQKKGICALFCIFWSGVKKLLSLPDCLFKISFGNEENVSVSAGLTQTLYSGGRIGAGIRAAKLIDIKAHADHRAVVRRVEFDVKKQFYNLLLARQYMDVGGLSLARSLLEKTLPADEARKIIEAAGHGDQFMHSLGHGIGREVHESPTLAKPFHGRLRAGMVVTVEPGIYLPGVGGVQLEDDVLIVPHGRRKLSSLPLRATDLVVC